MNKILEVKKFSFEVEEKSYFKIKTEKKKILEDVTFSISEGEIAGIAGESGSGKTSLLKQIAYAENSQQIIFSKRKNVQLLFQNNGEVVNPFRFVNAVIDEAIKKHNINANVKIERKYLFDLLNLNYELGERKGFQLSGGEQQRIALARILALKPSLLLLDEPFSAQDVESQLNLLNLFKKINTEFKITILCVAHNLNILQKLCSHIMIMYNGKIVENNSAENIFTSPEHPYTKFLLKAGKYDLSKKEIRELKGF